MSAGPGERCTDDGGACGGAADPLAALCTWCRIGSDADRTSARDSDSNTAAWRRVAARRVLAYAPWSFGDGDGDLEVLALEGGGFVQAACACEDAVQLVRQQLLLGELLELELGEGYVLVPRHLDARCRCRSVRAAKRLGSVGRRWLLLSGCFRAELLGWRAGRKG